MVDYRSGGYICNTAFIVLCNAFLITAKKGLTKEDGNIEKDVPYKIEKRLERRLQEFNDKSKELLETIPAKYYKSLKAKQDKLFRNFASTTKNGVQLEKLALMTLYFRFKEVDKDTHEDFEWFADHNRIFNTIDLLNECGLDEALMEDEALRIAESI